MNWEQKVERVAARARVESPPRVDVAQAVVEILTAGQAQPLTVAERLWMWLAAGAAAIAVPAVTVALAVYSRSSGPLSLIAEVISWATQ